MCGLLLMLGAGTASLALAQPPSTPSALQGTQTDDEPFGSMSIDPEALKGELLAAVIRLPIAALLGTALALRPRRRGTPTRQPAVVQTQIVLAVVGALIMLVVGASLARAFGIVGAANLIRYRSKIDDPKDAVVMLCALSVGLAAGVGLYGLATFGTMFLVFALWIIEGFEPQTRHFELSVKLGDKTAQLRPRIEAILRRFKTDYELRGQAEEEVSYSVTAPLRLQTDRVSNALTALVPTGKGAVEWKEKPKVKSN
ncbi:MAG: MgtC/SapB family protein [Acidobacteria bacterium]|nr:MgtC/SapB family protein [Acidobacteriota bacterium]